MATQHAVNQHKPLYPHMSQKPPFTVEASGYSKVKGETIPRRHPAAKDKIISTPDPSISTLFDIVKYSSEHYGNAKAIGWRKTIKTHQETKMIKKNVDGQMKDVEKKWTYFELGPYNYMSYVEYERLILQVGSGHAKLGLSKDSVLHVFATTSPHWLATAHGATSQSIPIATAYDTLGEEGLRHSLKQTKAQAIYTEPQLLKTVQNCLKDTPDLKAIIYNDAEEVKQDVIQKLKADYGHLKIMSFEEVRKLGEDNMIDPKPPGPEDLCCIMYTSGSTGTPKGVSIKHKAAVASVAGVNTIVGQYFGPGDRVLTYLPTAHILEYVVENAFLYWGTTMGYGNPKTLSDQSVRNCKGDIRELKPSILAGVPAVWESIKKGIIGKVEASNPIVRNLFWGALATKSFLMDNGLPGSGILDALVFNKIKDATGGCMKICLNGGGPISPDTQRFISMAICPMIGGYGLTETTAMGALCDPMQWTDKAIGVMESCIEIKLVDYLNAGYSTDSKPPQGEIWIRGPAVLEKYFDNEKETEESITEDGWFKTGDIGEFDSNGHLKLIDRKKNLVKTLNGEYIALEKLESVYRSAKIVGNICVYASPDHNKPVAIIVPTEPSLKKIAQQQGIKGENMEELVHERKVQDAVLKELQTAGKQHGLAGIEIVDGVVLADQEWTPQNGFTTAAQKIQRKKILNAHQHQVDEAYSRAG